MHSIWASQLDYILHLLTNTLIRTIFIIYLTNIDDFNHIYQILPIHQIIL
jgi:hypothetical protein